MSSTPSTPGGKRPAPPGKTGQLGGFRRLLPSRADYAGLTRTWRTDVIAGLTVGVVAIPLALAFGITSGLGADAGLTTAIVAGLVAAFFGGSNVQVSGPTGAMTVVLVPLVLRHGADAVFMVGLLAGLLMLVAGVAGIGRYLAFIPWSVVEGFTLGIAVIIFLQQVPPALGVARPEGVNTAVVAFRALARTSWSETTAWTLAIVALVVAIVALLPRLHRSLPASLLAVAAGTVLATLANAPVAVIGALPSALPSPSFPAISLSAVSELFGAVLAVALLGSLESLLSAKVADGMAGIGRHNPNRELFGQGLANIASPLFGGMPATGAIARTAVNVRAGAHTRIAAMTHAVVLLAVVYAGSGLVARVPLAALAGVLIMTSIRMVEVDNIRSVVRATRSDALVLVTTAAVTVAFDLIVAVEVGMATAAVLALRQLALTSMPTEEMRVLDLETSESLRQDHIVTYRMDGALFFGAAQRFLNVLSNVGEVRVVILRFPDLQMLDASGAQVLGEIIEDLEHRHITVLVKGLRPDHLRILREVGAIDRLAHEHHMFGTLAEAIAHARLHAGGEYDCSPHTTPGEAD